MVGKLSFTDKSLLSVGLIVLIWLFSGYKFTINVTDSIPVGLYLITDTPTGRGDYTIITDRRILQTAYQRGYIAKGTYIGKKIMAVPGDRICTTRQGVFINGVLTPKTRPLFKDSQGNTLPFVEDHFTLKRDHFFLLSENRRGYDSRYFGPVAQSETKYKLVPVLTFN